MENENLSVESNSSVSEKEEKTQTKNIVQGEAFRKLKKKAKRLGAKSLDYSKRRDMKYTVTLETGKKINFGSAKYEDYLIHKSKILKLSTSEFLLKQFIPMAKEDL